VALLKRLLVPLTIALGLGGRAAAQTEPRASATEIKAAYLLNFARYVEWPAAALGDSAGPLVICVVESNALEDALRRVAEGRTVSGRPVRVQVVRSSDEDVTCHVAYVGSPAAAAARSLQAAWADQPVLTVGEGEEFLAAGGIIGFVMVEQTVRFAINQEAAHRARLRISSRVLALAVRR
jgi:uncharacterized protein DUF4154